jgi:hypothetical protein
MVSAEAVTAQYINQRMAQLDRRKRELERRLKDVDSAALPAPQTLDSFSRDWPGLDVRQKNQLAKLFIEAVALSREGMTIYWKHQFMTQAPD